MFTDFEIDEAIAHAAEGGQGLHVWHGAGEWARAVGGPACFMRNDLAAHLFDRDANRLQETARRLGVRRIFIDKAGTDRQHIDLCGRPLARAIAESKQLTLEAPSMEAIA